MNDENEKPITCGYCSCKLNTILKAQKLLEHTCFSIYDNSKHVLRQGTDNAIVIAEKLSVNMTLQTPKVSDETPLISNATKVNANEYNEALINAVYSKPPLYDHKVPLKERTPLKKNALWKKVAIEVGENNVENVQKRWKQLRDKYKKKKNNDNSYVPSGSAGGTKPNIKFALYEQMKFLDDVVAYAPTVSNFDNQDVITPNAMSSTIAPFDRSGASESNAYFSHSILDDPTPDESIFNDSLLDESSKSRSSKKKKVKDSDENVDQHLKKAVLSAIQSSPKQPDSVDGFLIQIGHRLRALPLKARYQFEMTIMTELFKIESSFEIH